MLLVAVAMGIYLDIRRLWSKRVLAILLLKPLLAMVIGLAMVRVFELEAMIKTTVIPGCMAPVGFNTLIYAQRENMDNEYAANIASLTALLGLFISYCRFMFYINE